ncbi:MFS transporter [Oceanobacillus oncorhynchi]|uniref:MFS transporter n=1 Tax=Oceanobacillus oncorhynchi TaxID=545501 RepID=UPI0018671F69|nr:MFS transporter [Oceanobacillus oncorhynchi]
MKTKKERKANLLIEIWKKYPLYRDIQLTTIVTSFFGWSSFIAMLVLLGEITSTGIEFGLLWSISGLAPLIFSFFLGVYIDRWKKKICIVWSDLLRFFSYSLFLLIPILDGYMAITIFLVARFLTGILGSFNSTAKQVVIPQIVKKEDLVVANSLSYTITSTVRLSGAAVGGIIVTIFGVYVAYGLTALISLISGLYIARHKFEEKKRKTKKNSYISEMLEGLSYAKNNIYVLIILISAITIGTIIGSYNLMLERFSSLIYDFQEISISLLYISEGATSAIVGYYIAKKSLLLQQKWIYGVFYTLTGILWMLFTLTTNVFQGMIVLVFFGISTSLVIPFERTTMHTVVPEEIRGKIFSLWGTLTAVSIQFGALITGIIIDLLGTKFVTPVIGSFQILFGICFMFIFLNIARKEKNNYSKMNIKFKD